MMKESKFNITSSVLALVLGAVLAFVVTNVFLGEPEDVVFTTIDRTITKDVSEPDADVFNARSVDPTVEVYIGDGEE